MEKNYVKADSGNLPKVDVFMVSAFFKNNPNFYMPEIRNVKTALASRESYGDDAVGYVQLHRDNGLCTVKCKICPEHKVRSSSYSVTLVVDENEGKVVSCQCHDCAASAGGCKHAVAFLMWAHRRSEEPSCTSVECYWQKPTLSRVGTSLKYSTVKQLSRKETAHYTRNSEVLSEFLQEAKKRKIENCELIKYQSDFKYNDAKQFSLYHFFIQERAVFKNDVDLFLQSMREKMDSESIDLIEKSTREQSKSSTWHELRYGRITASRAYEVSRCQTVDGSLVAAIMGAKTPDTSAMRRGRILETAVRKAVGNKLKKKFTLCGLFLSKEYPMIAATPDGICKDAVIEIKCPTNEKTKLHYIKDNEVTAKYYTQVQLQMYASSRKRCYFCVSHPDFEKTNDIDIIVVEYDTEYVCNLLKILASFWKTNIFPLLSESTSL